MAMGRRWNILRLVVALLGVAIITQAMLLWNATGRARLTRYYDPSREASAPTQERTDLEALLNEAGVNDGFEEIEVPENRFAFGLLPSTYPWRLWDPYVLSVATVVTPAALIVLLSLCPVRRRREAS
jgi:hypothetical protein